MSELHWLFVYGTLRPRAGAGNHSLLRNAMAMSPFEECTTNGVMYHVSGGSRQTPIYPVVDFTEPGMVVGTLLLVRGDDPGLRSAHRMEVGAGYEPVWVEVTVPGWHQPVRALAYNYEHQDRGPRVPTGDWHQEQRSSERVQ